MGHDECFTSASKCSGNYCKQHSGRTRISALQYYQKCEDENNNSVYLTVMAQSNDVSIKRVDKLIKGPIQTRKLVYDPNSVYAKAEEAKSIMITPDIGGTLKSVAPEVPQEVIDEIVEGSPSKAIISIPLYARNSHFGWFNVFSSRKELTEGEPDFLTIFAQQIEMAITIAGLFEEVKAQAVTDSLTGLYNRRYFEEYLKKKLHVLFVKNSLSA